MTLIDDPTLHTSQAGEAMAANWRTTGERPTGIPRQCRDWVSGRHVLASAGRVLSDSVCVVVAFIVAGVLASDHHAVAGGLDAFVLVAPVPWVAVFWTFGLYRRDPVPEWEEFGRLLKATAVGTVSIVLAGAPFDQRHLRAGLVITWATALALELIVRPVWRWRLAVLRQTHRLAYKTLILGTNDEADQLAQTLARRDTGFLPLGYLESSAPRGTANGLQVLGTMRDLAAAIRQHGAECVFVASSGVSPEDLARLATVARREGVVVRVSTPLPNVLPGRVKVETVGEVATLSLKPVRLSTGKAVVKRAFDIAVASGLFLAALPIMMAVAVAVRLTSRGPVLFRQERVTKGGALFRIYKFRTMYDRADGDHDTPWVDPTALYFKLREDPRITKVGRFLRRYSLDELPQLWNVIRGDISLVGPRPLWSAQMDLSDETFRSRNEVRAGLTGWWQVNGRSSVDPTEALEMDLFYIENWSLTLDLYIVLKTIPTVFHSNAY